MTTVGDKKLKARHLYDGPDFVLCVPRSECVEGQMANKVQNPRLVGRRQVLTGGGVLAAVLAVGVWQRTRVVKHDQSILTPAEALQKSQSGEILLIDIRTPSEWRSTGVGSVSVPIDLRRDDFIDALGAAVDAAPGRRVALICARGGRSARLARQLAVAGYPDVIDVSEGMLGSRAGPGWVAAGLPLVPWDG